MSGAVRAVVPWIPFVLGACGLLVIIGVSGELSGAAVLKLSPAPMVFAAATVLALRLRFEGPPTFVFCWILTFVATLVSSRVLLGDELVGSVLAAMVFSLLYAVAAVAIASEQRNRFANEGPPARMRL